MHNFKHFYNFVRPISNLHNSNNHNNYNYLKFIVTGTVVTGGILWVNKIHNKKKTLKKHLDSISDTSTKKYHNPSGNCPT